MSAVVAPLFTAERDGRRLRTFAAEGTGPELPWYALADLAAALATTRAEEVELLAGLGAGALGLRLRSVVTADGPLVLMDEGSGFVLLFAIRTMPDGPPTLPAAAHLFDAATRGAADAATAGMTAEEVSRWTLAASAAARAQMESDVRAARPGGLAYGPA